jgi:hypothetical protein
MPEKTTEVVPRERQRLARRDPLGEFGSPFRMLERFADEMDRVFDDFGFSRNRTTSRWGQSWLTTPLRAGMEAWAPDCRGLSAEQ